MAGMSYTEFSYMLLQAYDFVHLHRRVRLPAAGRAAAISGATSPPASTWLGGMRGVQLYGITCPLLTKSDGTKMGKTESGTIWLVGRPDQSLRVLPVLDQRRRRRRRQCLRFLTELRREEIEPARPRPRRDNPAAARASGGWPRN